MKIFCEIGGEWNERAKIEREITNLWSKTKKRRSSEILADENRKFFRKR